MLPLEPSELQGDIINCEKFPWPGRVTSMYTYFMQDRRGAAPGVSIIGGMINQSATPNIYHTTTAMTDIVVRQLPLNVLSLVDAGFSETLCTSPSLQST
jgi:hypothetical protein